MSARPIGWDHADTARYYARFQRRHTRYRQANRELVRHAALVAADVEWARALGADPVARVLDVDAGASDARGLEMGASGDAMRILDVAAGDGGTTAAALERVGAGADVVCFEPAAAMRALGEATLRDGRVAWTAGWPDGSDAFDLVLCGAAVWQLVPLEATFRRIFESLRPGGCLCFDLPAPYLGEADAPGGGRDPLLLALPAALAGRVGAARGDEDGGARPDVAHDVASLEAALGAAGFHARRWRFALRLDQPAYRDWLKIPPTTDRLLLGFDADERARRIDAAFERVDARSWRWERWIGWTAWRPAA